MAQEEVTLERSLDNAANVLRSKMDANEYKNYTLGTIFYKYLSDSMLYYVAELLEEKNISLEEAQKLYEENQDDQYLIEELDIKFNYVIEAKNTYTNITVSPMGNGAYKVSSLRQPKGETYKLKTYMIVKKINGKWQITEELMQTKEQIFLKYANKK